MSRKNLELEEQKKMKNELDDILSDMKAEGRTDDIKAFSALKDENIGRVVALNYREIKNAAEKQASDHIDAIVGFYLSGEEITDNFLLHKMNRDKFRLVKQIVQLEIAEHAIAKLNEEIDNGNYNPRLWEVMGNMMKSFDSMNITYAKLEILIENNYKSIQEEIEYKHSLNSKEEDEVKMLTSGSHVNGHKELLKQIKSNMKLEAQ